MVCEEHQEVFTEFKPLWLLDKQLSARIQKLQEDGRSFRRIVMLLGLVMVIVWMPIIPFAMATPSCKAMAGYTPLLLYQHTKTPQRSIVPAK